MPKLRITNPVQLPKYVPVRKNAESAVPKWHGFLSGATNSLLWWRKRW